MKNDLITHIKEELIKDMDEFVSTLTPDQETGVSAKKQVRNIIDNAKRRSVPDEYYLFGVDVCLEYQKAGIEAVIELIKNGAHYGGLHLKAGTSIAEILEAFTNHSEYVSIEEDEYRILCPYLN